MADSAYANKAAAKAAIAKKTAPSGIGARLQAIKNYANKINKPNRFKKVVGRSGQGAVKGMSNFSADSDEIEKMIRGGS